jgi:hypothetical protein
MLLIKNKTLRQGIGVVETFKLLFVRLLLQNPSGVRTFPGQVFREYMGLVGKDRWVSKESVDTLTIPPGTRIILDHMPDHGIDVPHDEQAELPR